MISKRIKQIKETLAETRIHEANERVKVIAFIEISKGVKKEIIKLKPTEQANLSMEESK